MADEPPSLMGPPDILADPTEKVCCPCGAFSVGPLEVPDLLTSAEFRCPNCRRVIAFIPTNPT